MLLADGGPAAACPRSIVLAAEALAAAALADAAVAAYAPSPDLCAAATAKPDLPIACAPEALRTGAQTTLK